MNHSRIRDIRPTNRNGARDRDIMPREPFVSLVTPVYNTEPYLGACIKSVLHQTFQNWEYIIVDNCSTDSSPSIARAFALMDSRIRVVEADKFRPQVGNYNFALRQISGVSDYCKIVQADDWLYPECLDQMLKVAEENPSVGIVGAYSLLDFGSHTSVFFTGLPCPGSITDGREACASFLRGRNVLFGNPTSTLIRSEIVRSRDPFYCERSIIEDVEVCFDILRSWDFGFVHQVLTYTRRHNESLMSEFRKYDLAKLADLITIRKYGATFLEEKEYKKRRRQIEQEYRRILGRSVLRMRSKAFWEFQKRALEPLGDKLYWHKVGGYAFFALVNMALNLLGNPKATLGSILRYLSRKSTKACRP